jgi:hypothetical protein
LKGIHLLLAASCALAAAHQAQATAATYDVVVNTQSVAGTHGSLDFNFNPGPFGAQAAHAVLTSWSSDGTLAGAPLLTGDASGDVAGGLALNNDAAYNDAFQAITFGNSLTFKLSLSGSAIDSPDHSSLSGSSFAFSVFGDPAGTLPILTSDTADGFAYVVNVNLDGSTTAFDYLLSATTVPEPASAAFIPLGIVALLAGTAFSSRSKRR